MKIEKYLSSEDKTNLIWKFAYLGNNDMRVEKLKELSELAEEEEWNTENSRWENDILYSYFIHTFDKAAKDDLVLISKDEKYACFNTGLLTDNGEDIICMFNEFEASEQYSFHLYKFCKSSDWEFLNFFSETPEVVSYFDDPSKIYFDPNRELMKNLDHILDDNYDRFPDEIKKEGKPTINALVTQALELTVKKCKRNYRIAVPQYYKDKITYLLPIELKGHTMSLAVEEVNNRYRVNTIFTIEMAYKNARLLMKPEANWLSIATK